MQHSLEKNLFLNATGNIIENYWKYYNELVNEICDNLLFANHNV